MELKQSLSDWRAIVETCAAFGTGNGGRVYVGVADSGQCLGVKIGKGTLEDLANKIALNTSPKLVPDIETEVRNGKMIVIIGISGHPAKPVTAFGRAYRRSGRTNQILSAPEVADLYFSSRGVTWDETIREEATVEDIDPEKVRRFLIRARSERQWEVNPETPLPEAMAKLKMVRESRPTLAALLLFGKNPQGLLSQAKVRCARFKGTDEIEFLDMKVLEGDLIEQVENAMAFVRRNTSMAARIEEGVERVERWEYPLEALREAITNAVCHRDYASTGNVQIRIFDDRLEVSNPGELPEGLTVEDLRQAHESRPRNKLVADAFFLIKFIEQFGTGTGRMIRLCREAGVPEPEFESRAGSFRIGFQRQEVPDKRFAGIGLNERQRKALQQMGQDQRMSRADYQMLTGASERTARRDLQDLVSRRLVFKTGAGRYACYQATEPAKDG